MYVPGNSDVTINEYLIYIRTHKAAETVDSVQRLRALVWDFETIAVDVDADAGLTISGNAGQGGSIYGIDANAGAVAIDLANYPGGSEAPVDGDVIIFYAVDKTGGITVIDETAGTAITTTLDAVGEAVALEFTDALGWIFWTLINVAGAQNEEFTNIGRCEEKPTIKTSTEMTVKLGSGEEKDIAEKLELIAKDLQVNADNKTFLTGDIVESNVDVIYYCKVGSTIYPTKSIRVLDIPFNSLLEVIGNEINMVNLTSKKIAADIMDIFIMGLDV